MLFKNVQFYMHFGYNKILKKIMKKHIVIRVTGIVRTGSVPHVDCV